MDVAVGAVSTGSKLGKLGQFQPGQRANPNGRPKGSRNKLGEAFVADLYEDWKVNGIKAIQRVRDERPDAYLKVIAQVIPRHVELSGADGGPIETLDVSVLAAARRIAFVFEAASVPAKLIEASPEPVE